MGGDGWKQTTIGEFCPFSYGKSLPKKSRRIGSVRVFGSNGPVGWHDQPLIDGPGIIIGRKGTVGAVHYADGPFWPIDTTFYVSNAAHRDLRFTYYFLRSIGLDNMNTDSAVPGLNRNVAHALNISVPSLLCEQQAIACILGALDDKIELNRRMNETLEAMAQALFKSWFVDFDPVRAKAEGRQPPGLPPHIADLFPDSFEESELGEIPKGWKIASLSEIAHFLNGLALQRFPPEEEQALPVIKIAQLRKEDTKGADKASSNIDKAYIVEDGDVLFSWSGSLECVLWAGGPGALNQHLFKVTSDQFHKWFYYLWIHHHLPEFRHIAASKATTMGHIQRRHLDEAKVCIPGDELLEIANNVFQPMIEGLIARSMECRHLANVRDTLLPKLISGELRVPDAERIVGRCV